MPKLSEVIETELLSLAANNDGEISISIQHIVGSLTKAVAKFMGESTEFKFEGSTFARMPLNPMEINTLIKMLPDDSERIEAMNGICNKCGSVKNGNTCWGCYESPAANY